MKISEPLRRLFRVRSWVQEQAVAWAQRHYPGETQDVAARCMLLLMEILDEDPAQLSPASLLHVDIPMPDMLDIELLMAIEEEFGFTIPEQESIAILTLGDLIGYLHKSSAW